MESLAKCLQKCNSRIKQCAAVVVVVVVVVVVAAAAAAAYIRWLVFTSIQLPGIITLFHCVFVQWPDVFLRISIDRFF